MAYSSNEFAQFALCQTLEIQKEPLVSLGLYLGYTVE